MRGYFRGLEALQSCSPDANPGQVSPQAHASPDCASLHPGYLANEPQRTQRL